MANALSFSGVGSGLDFGIIRDAIIAQRSRPIAQLQAKASNFNGRIDSLKKFNAGLANLTTAADALTKRDVGTGKNASASDANILTATASSTAAVSSFEVNVTRLASNLTQASKSFGSATASFLANSEKTTTFELRKGGSATGLATLTFDSTNDSLSALRDAINNANVGVNASIVDVKGNGTEFQLVLNSKETGAGGRVELVETSTTGTFNDLTLRSLNPIDGDFNKLDSAFSINGLNLTRSTNTVSDAVTGVTLNLKKAGTASVNVSQSNDIENKVRNFVNAYNSVQEFIGGQYQKDGNGKPTGALAGDSILRSVQQVRDAVIETAENNGGSLRSLSEIGVTVGEDGKLSFDSTILNDKLKNNTDGVKALLFGKTENDKGVFQKVFSISSGLSDSVTGSVQTAIKGYETSIKSINDSINVRLEQINTLRDSLNRRFSAADSAIGQLNGQNTSLTNIIKSLQNNNN